MRAAQDGERAALDTLLRRHYDRLYALCRRMTGDDADAADACQEALMAIVRGLPGFDGRSAFGTGADRVTTTACLDELRRRRRRPEPGLPEGSAEVPAPDDAVEGLTTRLDLDQALQSLPADYRAAVVLRYWYDYSYTEIADILDTTESAIKSRLFRARQMLSDKLHSQEAPGSLTALLENA